MDEYEFLETEGGMEGRGRSREVTPLRKQQPGQQQQNRSSPQQPSCRSPQQESPLRRALEQPPLKRFKVSNSPQPPAALLRLGVMVTEFV